MPWQPSNMLSMARLKMFGWSRLYICARWNGLMRPLGLSMNTRMPCLPTMAASAAGPVSPEVAPRMFSSVPDRARAYWNRLPSSCMARSLKARVGPWDRPSRCTPGARVRTGVISALPNASAV